ncbi:MAG: URC4/urg3 family protein, partial [Pseudomonadota bacterium]|nr:URC4/urg3 family protein [Pseudomonadota bacterium]
MRERADEMLELATDGRIEGWIVDPERLGEAAELTAAVTRERYPNLDIPFHARWRHFVAGAPRLPDGDRAERARAASDLVILSVLLDAGAGAEWRYADPVTGETFARSEGLAVATQRLVEASELGDLTGVDAERLARGFQAREGNPLLGLEGRAALLRRLGGQIEARPDLFA